MPSSPIVRLRIPAAFLVEIYVYCSAADPAKPSLLHPPPKRVTHFKDLISASTKEGAAQKAKVLFWEDTCAKIFPGLKNIPERMYCLSEDDLPEHFYIDAQPFYQHQFEEIWEKEFSSIETRYRRRWGAIKRMLIPRRSAFSKRKASHL